MTQKVKKVETKDLFWYHVFIKSSNVLFKHKFKGR